MKPQWSLHRCTVRRISTRFKSVPFIAISSVQLHWMRSNPFLEMLLATALAFLLFFADMTLPETIEIARLLPENKRNNWKDVIDTFTLSESECNHTENQYINCTNLCKPVKKSGSRHFRCSCSDPSPTLTYNNRQWTCQGNRQVRSQLGE